MTFHTSPFCDRARAHQAALEWLKACTATSMQEYVKYGHLNTQLYISSSEGFSWAYYLAVSPEALAWAIDAGWNAQTPCLFKTNGRGMAEWNLFDLIAYEWGPCLLDQDYMSTVVPCLKLLGQHGFTMSERNPLGETALHGVARRGALAGPMYGAITDAILLHDRRVNLEDVHGQTPLHVARGVETITALLLAGAQLEYQDLRGVKAIDAVLSRPEGPQAFSHYERHSIASALANLVQPSKLCRL